MHRDPDGGDTFTIDHSRMVDIRQAAGRAGVEPHDLVELAIRRYLDELEDEQGDAAPPEADAAPALFFDWTR